MTLTRDPLDQVYGLSAALAAFQARPVTVARIAHTQEKRFALKEVLREAAMRRFAYREVSPEELSRMCDSQHHEGVCMWVCRGRASSLSDAIDAVGDSGAIFALDAVDNPHNVGAIVRTAAYFGVASVVVQTEGGRSLPPSALRVAEGGGEHVCVSVGSSLPRALSELRRVGFQIVGTDVRGGEPLAAHSFAARSVIVLGNERSGLSEEVLRLCDEVVIIPGADKLDSLNVSVAAGILAYELPMQRCARSL